MPAVSVEIGLLKWVVEGFLTIAAVVIGYVVKRNDSRVDRRFSLLEQEQKTQATVAANLLTATKDLALSIRVDLDKAILDMEKRYADKETVNKSLDRVHDRMDAQDRALNKVAVGVSRVASTTEAILRKCSENSCKTLQGE